MAHHRNEFLDQLLDRIFIPLLLIGVALMLYNMHHLQSEHPNSPATPKLKKK